MKLGISSYTYGWAVGREGSRPPGAMTAIDLIDRAVTLDVKVLQIANNLPPATYEPDSVAAIAAHAARNGIEIELGTRGSRPEHVKRFIAIARELRSSILRVVVDTADDDPDEAEVVRRLFACRDDAANAGVTIAIENHDRFKATALADIARQLWPQVGICLDTANSLGAMEGPDAVVAALAPYTVNLHLKDVTAVRLPYLQGFTIEGRPAGEGLLDIPRVLAQLNAHRRDVNVIAELWVPPSETLDATIAKEADWARRSVAMLRQLVEE